MLKLSKIAYKTTYRCQHCGCTSYRPVLERAPNGAVLPTGSYRCGGCRTEFDSVQAWWGPRRSPEQAPTPTR